MGKVEKLHEFFRFSGGFLAIAVIETVRVNRGICASLLDKSILTGMIERIVRFSGGMLFKLHCLKALGRNCLTRHLDTDLIDCRIRSP